MTDYNYRIDGTAITPTYATFVGLMEGVAGKRADLVDIAYQHGVYVAERHWSRARLMHLNTHLVRTPDDSTIYTALHGLENLLLNGIVTLARNDPAQGEVVCNVLISDPVEQPVSVNRFGWVWPTWQIKGYWTEATASHDVTDTTLGASANLTQINVGGTHPTEPVFTVTCQADGANPAIEDPATGDKITLADSFVATDVIEVDVPNRTVEKNGTRVKNLLTINRGHWMEFSADTDIDLDFTSDSGTWDVQTVVKNRFRG